MNSFPFLRLITAMLMLMVGTLFVVAFMVSCERSYGPELDKFIDFEGKEITVEVIFYEDRKELARAYLEARDIDLSGRDFSDWLKTNTIYGFADLTYTPIQGSTEPHPVLANPICIIHSMRVRGQRDKHSMETLGHELLHCLYGNWHPEKPHT